MSRFTYNIDVNNVITSINDTLVGSSVATIPDYVTGIASIAFSSNNVITGFVCPIDSSLNNLGNDAFLGCANLTSVTLGTTYLKSISTNCFYLCNKLQSITIP